VSRDAEGCARFFFGLPLAKQDTRPRKGGIMTDASIAALAALRSTENFQWYVVPLFVLVVYVYAVEIEKRNWSAVLAGLAFWGMDWFNEVWNGLVLHFTGHSACWTVPAGSAYVIFVGLNIEISLMFAILGIVFVKMLPSDKTRTIWGVPNRWFFVLFNSLLCVFIEILLNAADALIWEYWWWNVPFIPLIVILGYSTFMIVLFWVYDMASIKDKITVNAAIFAVDVLAIIVFAGGLKWI
jgi:hypothetical protein